MTQPSKRVVAIGLDAVELTVVERGVKEGWLPTLAGLLARGRAVRLMPPIEGFPGATWPTTITGTPPHEHHALFDRQLDPDSYRIVDLASEDIARPPFWSYVGEAGLRTTVCGIYANRLIPGLPGNQVVGLGLYDPFSTKFSGPRSDPPGLVLRLRKLAPRQRSGFLPALPRSISDQSSYLDHMADQVSDQGTVLTHLMNETEWDLFVGAFSEPHEAGHLLWHHHDPRCPESEPDTPAKLRTAIKDLYSVVDENLGRLLEACPAEASFFVFTPHGMGPHYRSYAAAGDLLARAGWMERGPVSTTGGGGAYGQLRNLARLLPFRVRWALGKMLSRRRWAAVNYLEGVDWARTKAFALVQDSSAHVRLNLKGREPSGIVEPDDYESTCEQLTRFFESLVDDASDQRLVEEAIGLAKAIGGPVTGPLPDVAVLWKPTFASRIRTEHGTVAVPTNDPRTGDHTSHGFLIAATRDGSGGASLSDSPTALLVDVAPTILAALGIEVPDALAGEPIAGLTGDA